MVTRLHAVIGVAFRWIALGLLGGLLAGCVSYPPAPTSAASADYRYNIGPGDSVNISYGATLSYRCLFPFVQMA
jgi:hypothetical protein